MNIKKKLIAVLLIVSSLPILVFTSINLYFYQNTATKNAMEENLKRSEVVQEKVSNLIDQNLYGIKVLSRSPILRSYDVGKIKPVIDESLKVYPDFYSIVVSNINGQEVVKSNNTQLVNIGDRAFFQLAAKGQEEVVSEVLVNKADKQLITAIAAPIRDRDGGKLLGVLQGNVKLSVLNNFVKELSKDNVTIYILDNQGKLLAHPTKNLEKSEDRIDLKNFQFVKNGLAGNSGAMKVNKDGKNMIVSYIQNKKTGWVICAEIPYQTAIKDGWKNLYITSAIGLVILFVTCVLALLIASYATKPILLLLAAADKIAKGDLSIKNIDIKSKDEIGMLGKTFENMVVNLKGLIDEVKEHSLKVSQSSKEMIGVCEQQTNIAANTADNINRIAEETLSVSSSIEKINSNMNTLDKMIVSISEKSNVVSDVVNDACSYSEKGSDALLKVNTSMTNIHKSVSDTAVVASTLDEHSKVIGQITEAIKGISEETNLLALNAAIEAAKAGEHGKGFAVVADEVRDLAEQSNEAAVQVHDLINGIKKEIDNVVSLMKKCIGEVNDGSKVIDEASRYFELIFKSIQEISVDIKNVSGSIEHMTENSREVSNNLNMAAELSEKVSSDSQGISAATEEQVASIEEVTASAENFSRMAENLDSLSKQFKTN